MWSFFVNRSKLVSCFSKCSYWEYGHGDPWSPHEIMDKNLKKQVSLATSNSTTEVTLLYLYCIWRHHVLVWKLHFSPNIYFYFHLNKFFLRKCMSIVEYVDRKTIKKTFWPWNSLVYIPSNARLWPDYSDCDKTFKKILLWL